MSNENKTGTCLDCGPGAVGAHELPIVPRGFTGHLGSTRVHRQPDCECGPFACKRGCNDLSKVLNDICYAKEAALFICNG